MRMLTKIKSNRNASRLIVRLAVILATLMASAVVVAMADDGREAKQVRIRDKCDPVTFNAVLGPGACVGNGNVTFAQLLATLNPKDGGHKAWRFSPSDLDIESGESVHVVNVGGETHTFTEVKNFGAGSDASNLT